MNFGKLYTDLTKLPPKDDKPESTVAQNNESEARVQIRMTWKQSTMTQEFVEETVKEIGDLIDKSVSLSVAYPTTNNHHQIIQNLVRVDALKRLLNKYIYNK